MLKETWQPIPDFSGYEVSDQGRVRSFWYDSAVRCSKTGKIIRGEKILGDCPNKVLRPSRKRRYFQVTLCKDGRHHYQLIHRLVLETFVGPCPPNHQACHCNGDNHDNRLSNLRWDSQSSNAQDRIKHGRGWNTKGANSYNVKLTEDQVLQIRKLAAQGYSQSKIAKHFGIDPSHINHIVHRRRWAHLPLFNS